MDDCYSLPAFHHAHPMSQTSSRDTPELHGLARDRNPKHAFWLKSHNRRKTRPCPHHYPMLCPDCEQTSVTFRMPKTAQVWMGPGCSLQAANHQEVGELSTHQPKPQPSRGSLAVPQGSPGKQGWGAMATHPISLLPPTPC